MADGRIGPEYVLRVGHLSTGKIKKPSPAAAKGRIPLINFLKLDKMAPLDFTISCGRINLGGTRCGKNVIFKEEQ